jgi:hypothetical protein
MSIPGLKYIGQSNIPFEARKRFLFEIRTQFTCPGARQKKDTNNTRVKVSVFKAF